MRAKGDMLLESCANCGFSIFVSAIGKRSLFQALFSQMTYVHGCMYVRIYVCPWRLPSHTWSALCLPAQQLHWISFVQIHKRAHICRCLVYVCVLDCQGLEFLFVYTHVLRAYALLRPRMSRSHSSRFDSPESMRRHFETQVTDCGQRPSFCNMYICT